MFFFGKKTKDPPPQGPLLRFKETQKKRGVFFSRGPPGPSSPPPPGGFLKRVSLYFWEKGIPLGQKFFQGVKNQGGGGQKVMVGKKNFSSTNFSRGRNTIKGSSERGKVLSSFEAHQCSGLPPLPGREQFPPMVLLTLHQYFLHRKSHVLPERMEEGTGVAAAPQKFSRAQISQRSQWP